MAPVPKEQRRDTKSIPAMHCHERHASCGDKHLGQNENALLQMMGSIDGT